MSPTQNLHDTVTNNHGTGYVLLALLASFIQEILTAIGESVILLGIIRLLTMISLVVALHKSITEIQNKNNKNNKRK